MKVEKHVSSQLFVFVSFFSHAQQLWKLMFVENVVTCVDPSPMSIRAGIVAERKKNFCITCIKSLLMFTLSRCYVRVFHSFDLFYPFHTFWSILTKKTNKMSAIFYIEWVWYFAVCVCARVSVHVMKAMSICTIYFSTPFGFISNSVSIRIIQVWCNWNMWPSNSIFGVFHVWYQRAANRQTMMATTTAS